MQLRRWKPRLFAVVTCAALVSPASLATATAQAVPRPYGGIQATQGQEVYARGFREGHRQGEQDARRGRNFGYDRNPIFRDGDRGYSPRMGSREAYRAQFRHGYANGYRAAYDRILGASYRQHRTSSRQGPRGYQEPAYARGYADGYARGLDDGRRGNRYDPVGSREYREGDRGYDSAYGSRDAYRANYRAGFRQGYEDGYRNGTR